MPENRVEGSAGVRPIVLLLVSITVVAGAYAGALDAPLIWDDLQLVGNSSVEQLRAPWYYLMSPFLDMREQSPDAKVFYRPLVNFSLALDFALHGRNPTGFHLSNLAMHLCNVACVFALARRLGARPIMAAAGALAWGLLPRLAESVSWVSGRTDLLAAMGVLGGLLVWRKGHFGRLALGSAIVFLGMLAKEMAVGGTMALAAAELLPYRSRRTRWGWLIPLSFTAVYLVLRIKVMGALVDSNPFRLSVMARIGTAIDALGQYVWMTIDVWHPQTQIGVIGQPSIQFVLLGVISLGVAATLVWQHAGRLDGLGLALVVAAAIPVFLVSHAIPLPWVVVAGDRLMYLPWAALAVALAVVCTRADFSDRARFAAAAAYLAWMATVLPALHRRVAVFADEVEFWIDAVETTPSANWGPTLTLSALCERAGLYEESFEVLRWLDGREPYPIRVDLPLARLRALARLGHYETALQLTQTSRLDERSAAVTMIRARLALHVLDFDGAQRLTEHALHLLPEYRSARDLLATIQRLRELTKAQELTASLGLEREVSRARIAMLAGRRNEAESAWLPLLDEPRLPDSDADEGFAFIAELGAREAMVKAIASYSQRPHAREDLVLGARERLRFSERMLENWPRVRRALDRLVLRSPTKGESSSH